MKITTKGRYGLRAMVDLAINSGSGHVALSEVAQRQGISANYLEQVFAVLRKAGLVKSIKGAQGGYILAMKPDSIKVGDILRALEGNLSVINENDDGNPVDPIQICLRQKVWDRIDERINSIVDSVTLGDLVSEYKRLNGWEEIMYYI
ncbi:MAG TPA: RrF2 family transcriptional regulator [Clostridiaceae bacterium]|nr:RrF2 family transcriptional regulator [Clostridiaceae bacterium]